MENGLIQNRQLAASSQDSSRASAYHARLNNKAKNEKSKGAWISAENDFNPWFQVNLNNEYTFITGVATQGRQNKDRWVTKYKLLYWGVGVHVQYYKDEGQSGGQFKVTKLNFVEW